MTKSNLWFTRRGNEIRGPFPVGMITRYILLGRIVETDELSPNQFDWKPVTEFQELYPVEMTLDQNDSENVERLRIARLREDERQSGDRRNVPDAESEFRHKRSGDERRDSETYETVRHREVKTGFRKLLDRPKERHDSIIALLIVFVSSVIWAGIHFSPERGVAINNCASSPAPHVNWSNCQLEGIKLTAMDLTGSQFRNSAINGADLRKAILVDTDFSYANLSGASVQNAVLTNANLVGTTLRNTNFAEASMTGANLEYAILHNANLANADLRNADFTHAMLNGAELKGARLDGAIFDKAIWSDNTVCAPESVGRCIPLPPVRQ